jgi:WD40 repeat protein
VNRMVQMDIGEVLDSASLASPPSLTSSSSTTPSISLASSTSPEVTNQQAIIQALEREFHQVRQHIKLLILKKSKLLREIHTRKRRNGESTQLEQDTLNRWKDVSARYSYAMDDCLNSGCVEKSTTCFPLFGILPNEVILHIFSYLGAAHLCQSLMRVCTLFCAIALDEYLWKPLYYHNWGDHRISVVVNSSGSVTWRSLFGRQSLTERNWWRGHNTVSTIVGHKGAVRCMQFTGDTMITGSADKTIKVWNLNDGQCKQTLHDNKWVRCLRFDAPTATLVTTGMDSTQVKVWSLTANTVSYVLDVHRGWITSLQLNMPRLVTGSLDGTIRVWDASTGHNQPNIVVNSGHDSLRSLWLSGDMVMSAGLERSLQLWDLRVSPSTTKPVASVEGAPHGNYCVQFDLHSHTVCSGSNGVIALADLRAPSTPTALLRGHTDVVSCLQFAGKKLVSGSMDHTIRVWDLTAHKCANTLHGHESWVWDLQLDPDKVVTTSGDKAVKLWAFNRAYEKSAM